MGDAFLVKRTPEGALGHLPLTDSVKNQSQSVSHSVMSDSLWPHGWKPASLLCLWKNTGVGRLSPLQGSSRPRDQTPVSCIAGRFFTSWATVETSVTHSVTWAIANFWGLASFEEVWTVVCAYGVFVRIRRDRDSEDNL